MLFIKREGTNPYFNIAAEEYFLKNFKEDIFMLWQNSQAIILGKHQNTLKEINLFYVNQHKIPVIRRISGGGTVFHDLGNLNFSFIRNGASGKLVNFEAFTKPIIHALKSLGLEAKFEGKNDLRIKGLKISGNAEHVHKNRVLHHGTLLFSSDLDHLNKAILTDKKKFKDKAINSNRSIVTNIKDHLENKIGFKEFKDFLEEHIKKDLPYIQDYTLSNDDVSNINALVNEKYNTWEWNYGYSPKYNFNRSILLYKNSLDIHLEVQSGIIKKVLLNGMDELKPIESILIGVHHDKDQILKAINLKSNQLKFSPELVNEFTNGMF